MDRVAQGACVGRGMEHCPYGTDVAGGEGASPKVRRPPNLCSFHSFGKEKHRALSNQCF